MKFNVPRSFVFSTVLMLGCFSDAGATTSPRLVKDIGKRTLSGFPEQLTKFKGKLLFVSKEDLWVSDGSASGTVRIMKGVYPSDLAATSDKAFFYTTYGTSLNSGRIWTTDGTAKNTHPVKNITPSGLGSSFPSHPLVPFKERVYFQGISSLAGGELWKSDGIKMGTGLIKDIYPGSSYSRPNSFTPAGDILYFKADDGTHGSAIWKTNGTAAGTNLVIYGAECGNLTPVGDALFFCFTSGGFNVNGGRMWKTYGNGGYEVAQFEPFCLPKYLTNVGGTLFFNVESSDYGEELWKSDGTSAGTVMIKDINPVFNQQLQGPGESKPNSFLAVGKTLYFAADNGYNGEELWRSDGTDSGTYMVKNINPNGSASPRNLVRLGNLVYFSAWHPATGRELWVSDGTDAGTRLVKDLYKGIQSSDPSNLTIVGNRLFFTSNDGIHGVELWCMDSN